MVKKRWIVFFGEDWARHHSTGQYLARELASNYKVLWVNSLGLRSPKINPSDINRIRIKLYEFMFGGAQGAGFDSDKPPDLHVAAPLAIPLLKFHLVKTINRQILKVFFNKLFKRYKIVNPIVITACPSTAIILDDIDATQKIYYCADEHSELAGMDSDLVKDLEADLLTKVGKVFASARLLQACKSEGHTDVYYLPHGVDYEHFRAAINTNYKYPDDLPSGGNPLIGFIGLIGEHIDLELISYVSEHMPDASLVMIGPIENGLVVPKAKNIHYLGAKSFSVLPEYLAHFNVCMLPYAQTLRNKYANPTKVREYLAAGCPVVCTPQDETNGISDDIYVAGSPEEFVSVLNAVVIKYDSSMRPAISEVMRSHSWEARAAQMVEMMDS